MSTKFSITVTEKIDKYTALYTQLEAILYDETDTIAALSTVTAGIKATFDFLWVGFYRVKEKQLVVGPFQGPIACLTIDYGKGVCGKAWKDQATVIVQNVDLFIGHIACSPDSSSEIVVPVFNDKKQVVAVLDIDSTWLSDFDSDDQVGLEKIVGLLKGFSY